MAMSFSELTAATLSGSWSHKLRPARLGAVFHTDVGIAVPAAVRAEMLWLECISGGEAVFYGGCFDAWRQGIAPRDIDVTVMSTQHPLITWGRILVGAALAGKPYGKYLWRHSLPWKRARIKTKAGLLDIGCIRVSKNKTVRSATTKQIADNADFGVIAAGATVREQFYADRFVDDHARGVVSCRRLYTRRDYRNGVYKRIPKYMLDKYPDRPFEFECAGDARFFKPMFEKRAAWKAERPSAAALTATVREMYWDPYAFNPPRS